MSPRNRSSEEAPARRAPRNRDGEFFLSSKPRDAAQSATSEEKPRVRRRNPEEAFEDFIRENEGASVMAPDVEVPGLFDDARFAPRGAERGRYTDTHDLQTSLTTNRADARLPGEDPRKPRTSASYPIKPDFVPALALGGLRGKLGMAFAPGKKDPAGHTASWDRDLDHDLADMRHKFGVGMLVSLVEDHELKTLKIEKLVERGAIQRINVVRFPVRDVDVPAATRAVAVKALVKDMVKQIAQGRTVVTHCRGGLGRAGTFAALVLVELGWAPDLAVTIVRASRKGTIQTAAQERYIHDYAKGVISPEVL